MIEFACPGCGNLIAVQEKYAGKRGTCNKCRRALVVPHVARVVAVPLSPTFDLGPTAGERPAVAQEELSRRRRRRKSVEVFIAGVLFGALTTVGTLVWAGLDLPFRTADRGSAEKRNFYLSNSTLRPDPVKSSTLPLKDVKGSETFAAADDGVQEEESWGDEAEQPQELSDRRIPQSAGNSGIGNRSEQPAADPDETAEGKRRLAELLNDGKRITREIKALDDRRQPLVHRRKDKSTELETRQLGRARAVDDFNGLRVRLGIAKQNNTLNPSRALSQEISYLEQAIANQTTIIARFDDEIRQCQTEISNLDAEIQPLNEQLAQQWNQMNDARNQWVAICQPAMKYVRGDYEALRRILDQWLLNDGLWRDAQCWGVLCAYEMREFSAADSYLRNLLAIDQTIGWQREYQAVTEGLKGLVWAKTPGQVGLARDAVKLALKQARAHKAGWQAYFIIGRYYADEPNEHAKAEAHLVTCLKKDPSHLAAKVWLGKLRTTTPSEKVRDVESGIELMEEVWKATGRKSWRLALDLAIAYRNGGRTSDADALLQVAMEFAPDRKDAIQREFDGSEPEMKASEMQARPR